MEFYYISFVADGVFSACEFSLEEDEVFIPFEVASFLERENDFDRVTLLNWKKLEENQLSDKAKQYLLNSDSEEG